MSTHSTNSTMISTQGAPTITDSVEDVAGRVSCLQTTNAIKYLDGISPEIAAEVLKQISPIQAAELWMASEQKFKDRVACSLAAEFPSQWKLNQSFPDGTLGKLMEPAFGLFHPGARIHEVLSTLRGLVKREFVTYLYVTSDSGCLEGLVVMRDLLFAAPDQTLGDIMVRDPFALNVSCTLMDAMHEVLTRHYPVYPVVDAQRRLLGLVRGYRLFEAQAVEISAQAGSMVGVEKEERVSTPWIKSFRYRHPWLQLNLLTAFVAGAVVNCFQGTIDQIVVLASFLPVLAGQSGNTGCQALAVTLRGMTLGELSPGKVPRMVLKEALLGVANGCFVGISAALGMYLLARSQGNPNAFALSAIVLVAMMASCCVSGLSGALVPLALKKVGADPATASSIFLTTATDVASMGLLLSLATAVLL